VFSSLPPKDCDSRLFGGEPIPTKDGLVESDVQVVDVGELQEAADEETAPEG